MKRKILKFSIKLSVSLAFLMWIIFKVEWREVFSLLGGIKIPYIAIYFLLLISGMFISSYKWKLLAGFKGIHASLFQFFKLYLVGTFINNFMPSFVGGDTYRIYQSGKDRKKFSESASAVVMDRLTGLFGAMILAVIFSIANISAIAEQEALLWLNATILFLVASGSAFYMTRRMLFWKKLGGVFGANRMIPGKFLKFFNEIMHYSGEKRILGQATAWSVFFAIIGVSLTNYVIFLSLGEKLSILDFLSVIFLISFISSLPISINNIGVKEWAYVTFFGFFGISSAVAITAAILGRVLQMLFSFMAFPLYLKGKK